MDQTQSALINLQEAVKKHAEQQQKIALEIEKQKQQAATDKMVNTLERILSSSYEKATAYNNAVIVAGYASFFAIWAATKPALTQWISITSALLMVVSATIFVGYELFKMIQNSRTFLLLRKIANDPEARKNPMVFQSKTEAFERLQRSESLRCMGIWVVVLGCTVSTAVSAIGLLVYSYIYALIN
ncbi:hypothetical protein G9Q38_13125 [Pusillimonas sp. DMV24BSW_D]|uniref:hypothetical protein n=1 Tax=Neopusillimonas aestuarii TaxID=2716226 RepID=UPI001409D929|nr:hypothetical protein [Pusillimonas sp. DMV24BSW_D]QIM50046.1 hypothetical protein G9Q38_13125 [Pusillimonas sp. DMV24BSW_D]